MKQQNSLPILGIVQQVLRAKAVPYTRPGSVSGIDKKPLSGAVSITVNGLAGDEQGDLRVHGGPDKAVHLYPYEHYDYWRQQLGPLAPLDQPGGFGENLSTLGVNEHTVCLGDRIKIGSVLLEVSQGRRPCWKLNDRFGVADMAQRLQQTLKTGWYFRVLAAGSLAAGDSLELQERPWPAWPISRIMGLMFQRSIDEAELREMLQLPLGERWHNTLNKRLQNGRVEDWAPRLQGP